MVAQSRSLALLPSSWVCPAVLPASALSAETQQILLVKPFVHGLLEHHHTSKEAATAGPSFDTMPAAAAHLVEMAPAVYDHLLCNASFACCLADCMSVPAAAPAARDSTFVQHAAPTISATLPDLRSWNWFQTQLFGSFMFSLGAIVPGVFLVLCVINQCRRAIMCQ